RKAAMNRPATRWTHTSARRIASEPQREAEAQFAARLARADDAFIARDVLEVAGRAVVEVALVEEVLHDQRHAQVVARRRAPRRVQVVHAVAGLADRAHAGVERIDAPHQAPGPSPPDARRQPVLDAAG